MFVYTCMCVCVCVWPCSVCLRSQLLSCGVCGLESVQPVWTLRPVCAPLDTHPTAQTEALL